MNRPVAGILILFGIGVSDAPAQAVIQADGALIQPQIYRDGPTIDGCGQRIVLSSVVSEREAYIADSRAKAWGVSIHSSRRSARMMLPTSTNV